jgi:hypothetical protein
MSIHSTSLAAANRSATSWATNAVHSARFAISAAATKVSNLASAAFRALAHYASSLCAYVKQGMTSSVNAVKAHPQIAAGVAVALLALAAVAYAYQQNSATA